MYKNIAESFDFLLRQSEIQTRKSKMAGAFGNRFCAHGLWGCGPGAAAKESPAARVSIGVPRQFGWLCASLAT